MDPKLYRDIEISKVIDNAFKQFKITDPNEKADITNSIMQQLDATAPVSTYQEDEYASSSVYRANVRNALIDIISQLLGIKDTHAELNKVEGISRSIIEESKIKLEEMRNALIGFENKIKESFTEGLDSGTHKNTIVKEDNLRVDFLDQKIKINSIDCVISPANSVYDNVVTNYSNNKEVLFKTGIGSDVFHVTSTCNKKPGKYIGGKYYEGIILEFIINTESCIPKAISSKSSGSSNIALWEGYNAQEDKWIVLGSDKTLGEYSYIDTKVSTAYAKYRVNIVFPDFIINNNVYYYEALLHNIKLFKQDAAYEHTFERGNFESKKYPISSGFFKAVFDANYKGWANFRIKFNGRPEAVWDNTGSWMQNRIKSNEYYVIPKNEFYFKYAGRVDSTLPDQEGALRLPFNVQSDGYGGHKYIHCYDASGEEITEFDIITIPSSDTEVGWGSEDAVMVSNYVGMIYVKYHPASGAASGAGYDRFSNNAYSAALVTQGNTVNDLPTYNYIAQTDTHDKLDGFRFPISSLVWDVFSNQNGRFTFTVDGQILVDEDASELEDGDGYKYPEEVFPEGNAVLFSEDRMQYYLKDKVLYTNFNLLNWNSVTVSYYKMCDSISLLIDLYDDATVDNYYLELISSPPKNLGTYTFPIDDIFEEIAASGGQETTEGGTY
tara:strand:+ start:15969 stop:17966 length:1998 start_codon:yes stop_codon:yes gene_type:complete